MSSLETAHVAPPAVGPYSPAAAAAGLLFVSGQIPLDPTSGGVIDDDIAAATHQVLANLKAVLASAGLSLAHVVKVTIFLVDMADFDTVNAIYADYFKPPYPARACVAVGALPKWARIEIEAIAARGCDPQ